MDKKMMRKIEDRTAETKAKAFYPPTDEDVVKAWEAFARRVVDVYDPDTEVEIERGYVHMLGFGDAGDIIRGIELRKEDSTPAEELDAWMKVSDFMGDVLPRFANPTEDRALFLVKEWNDLMNSIAYDEDEATPEIRQAAEDQKIVALGCQNGSLKGMEIYSAAGVAGVRRLRKYDVSATIIDYYTTQAGVHEAIYAGWTGDDKIIYAGGYVNGTFVRPDEVDRAGLFDKLSENVRSEMESTRFELERMDLCWTSAWNDKILEIQDDVDPKDAELLDALWIGAEVLRYDEAVVVYGVDDGVTKMDEDDFKILGLHRTYGCRWNALDR